MNLSDVPPGARGRFLGFSVIHAVLTLVMLKAFVLPAVVIVIQRIVSR